ncbi:uncharacterized protein [Cicer arietinum]|uniref:uncharacterized protein n=1 Tax=Cicer arietinum TaxID=3827 RepID=UPI003CC646BE
MGDRLGDGHRILTLGKCEGVPLVLGNITITVEAYLLGFTGADLILGVVWLETLGKVTMDWKEMSMVFNHGGPPVHLQGLSTKGRAATLQSVIRNDREADGGGWSTSMEVGGGQIHRGQSEDLQQVLSQYAAVFKEIEGLPPLRNTSHVIFLQHGAGPISVRPYRYPHYQKDEIEKQINTLLQKGVIRNNTSSFSSPVILVKKKDSLWRMCVDYRGLNKRQVEYLGHVISEQGVTVDPSKAAAETAFEQLNVAVTSAPVLALPNFELPFEIECDATGKGVRAVLKFVVYSDQKSLRHLIQQRITTAITTKLLGFDFEVVYKQGGQLQQEVLQHPVLKRITKAIRNYPRSKPGYVLRVGILFYKDRLVIPAYSPLIEELLKEFHSSPNGGHLGFLRTYRRMAGTLYWHGMMKRVQEFVNACDTCQRQKYDATTPSGLLQPLPIPVLIWSEISMDFITSLSKSNGYEAILVVVDRPSKYSHFIPLKHPFTARSIATIFVKEVIRLHGIPELILSDRDPLFVSIFWKKLFKLLGTVLKMSSAYHPQTNGQTEVINRCLEDICVVLWLTNLSLGLTGLHGQNCGTTPLFMKPPVLVHYLEGETRVEAVAQELRDQDEALRQLKYNLTKTHEYMKYYADKKRKDVQFAVGD